MSDATAPLTAWLVVDTAADAPALLGAARMAGGIPVALVIGERELADHVGSMGPTETRWLGAPDEALGVAGYASPIAEMAKEASSVVLLTSSPRHRLLTGLVAGHLGTSAFTDVTSLARDGDVLTVTRPHYGGAAVRTEQVVSPVAVLALVTGTFPADVVASPPGARVLEMAARPAESPVHLVSRRSEASAPGRLTTARSVVGAGRGFSKVDNLELVEGVARALGAEIACTRPVAEELHWLPRERYLGVSGLQLAPDLYLAIGISGQVQHMIGVEGAKVIAAINNDRAAPVFAQADYGVVGDLAEVLPALVAALATP